MSLLDIVKWPSLKLKEKSLEITSDDFFVAHPNLIKDMTETMHAAGGIGLSAIQVGLPYSLFVTKFPGLEVVINPFVQKTDDAKLVDGTEGCLSLPGFIEHVKRWNMVSVSYYWLAGGKMEGIVGQIVSGLEARCFQHEAEHCRGGFFLDYVRPARRDAIRASLRRGR